MSKKGNKNLFNSIQVKKQRTNMFDLSHDFKLSANMGNLIPVLTQECVPGDTFYLSGNAFARFAPLKSPVMHRLDLTLHYWYVPTRLVWENFSKWLYNPSSTIVHPYLELNNQTVAKGSLLDYIGLPTGRGLTGKINPIPLAAYQMIYNQRYRDQNLCPEINYKLTDGFNGSLSDRLVTMRNRAWEHDYFTSALPFAQKGPAVDIPMLGNAPVKRNNDDGLLFSWDNDTAGANVQMPSEGVDDIESNQVYADLSDASSATINDLRRAFKLQEWLELAARAGTRIKEATLAFFGVDPGDARINDPEYITGIKTPVVVNEVENTTGEISGLPQGNLAGKGTAVASGQIGKYFCREHGYIIGVLNVQPKSAYMDGAPKHLVDRFDQFKYFFPQFAHIGEQEILNKEIFMSSLVDSNEGVFGYTPRFSEYKYNQSRVAGEFRDTLQQWHFARKFATLPTLSQQFIEAKEGINGSIRTDPFAVTNPAIEKLYIHVLHNIRAKRPMPVFGSPSF